MRVHTFPMYGFREGFLAIFGRARAPRNGRLDIFQTFMVTLHPLFELPQTGRTKRKTKSRAATTYDVVGRPGTRLDLSEV